MAKTEKQLRAALEALEELQYLEGLRRAVSTQGVGLGVRKTGDDLGEYMDERAWDAILGAIDRALLVRVEVVKVQLTQMDVDVASVRIEPPRGGF